MNEYPGIDGTPFKIKLERIDVEDYFQQQKIYVMAKKELIAFHNECVDCYSKDSFKNWKNEKLGRDHTYIQFTPICENEISKNDVIENIDKGFQLYCIDKHTFVLYNNDKRDFITKHDLFTEYKKI